MLFTCSCYHIHATILLFVAVVVVVVIIYFEWVFTLLRVYKNQYKLILDIHAVTLDSYISAFKPIIQMFLSILVPYPLKKYVYEV